ncbi:MAG: hypothetical protein WC436_05780, partial [Candidatus Babeliales bacterium]
MKKNTENLKAGSSAVVCAIMVLAGVAAAYAQNPSAAGEELLVKTVAYTSEGLRDPFEGYIRKEVVPLSAAQLAQEENF